LNLLLNPRFPPAIRVSLTTSQVLKRPREVTYKVVIIGGGKDALPIILARIIHIFEDNKGPLCYKHVD